MAKTEEKEVKKESRVRLKKKAWHKILAPKEFQHQEIGESYLPNGESAVGRIVKINLRELTGNPKDQSAYLVFRIEKAEGLSLHTSIIGYEMLLSTMKRMAKLGADRLDDSFICKSKKGTITQIKAVMITLRKTDRSVQAKLRQILHAVLQEELGKGDFLSFIQGLVETRIRIALKKRLDKVYPVRELAIRYLRLLKAGKEDKEEAVAEELSAGAEFPAAESLEQEGEAAVAPEKILDLEPETELAVGHAEPLTEQVAERATA